ncbi:MAG: hypothetical protein OQL19_03145 [Gammaproteobacteria bacterium]|nr:hypothetical protein [Gammaproteobacteria bacterium]
MMKKLMIGFMTIAILGFSQVAVSQRAWISDATVEKVLIDGTNYGGCMVRLDKTLANYGLNCLSRWVTFSCVGTFGNKDIGFKQLDQAQIAMALNKKLNLYVDDLKKHNGYCYGARIDLLP